MSASAVRSNEWSIFKCAMNRELGVVLAPHLVPGDWGMMGNLFHSNFILTQLCLEGLTQDRVEGLSHLNGKLSDANCIGDHKL